MIITARGNIYKMAGASYVRSGSEGPPNAGEYPLPQLGAQSGPAAFRPDPVNWLCAPTLTAWSGPWGVSFTANLTPDPETSVLRDFTEEQFIQTMRTGRHQGQG